MCFKACRTQISKNISSVKDVRSWEGEGGGQRKFGQIPKFDQFLVLKQPLTSTSLSLKHSGLFFSIKGVWSREGGVGSAEVRTDSEVWPVFSFEAAPNKTTILFMNCCRTWCAPPVYCTGPFGPICLTNTAQRQQSSGTNPTKIHSITGLFWCTSLERLPTRR